MNPRAEFMVEIRLPNSGKVLRSVLKLDETIFNDTYAPLPRDREIPFEVQSQIRASEMRRARMHVTDSLAKALASKIIEIVEAEDPVNGYSPEEWRRISGERRP